MSRRTFAVAGFVLALVVAGVVSQLASGRPDGLEHVAQSLGFHDTARESVTSGSPFADYSVAGVGGSTLAQALAQALAGVLGCLATFALVAALTRRRPQQLSRPNA